ncbi:hypothetical protein [Aeromicrobium sp. NPDC092404]|uniref:hypothetical protein n=1 Tax=Aeromicrobium sp. NPDC092404 TaxID=3154976 RepID=UPI00342307C1
MTGILVLASCSSDPDKAPDRPRPTALTAEGIRCDRERATAEVKDTIERVGGLVADDYVVRFSQSTQAGVVALVDGDVQKAFDELTSTTAVTIVAKFEDDTSVKVTGFQQVRDLVASVCG